MIINLMQLTSVSETLNSLAISPLNAPAFITTPSMTKQQQNEAATTTQPKPPSVFK